MVEVIINFEICFLGPKGPPGDAGANGKLTSWFAFTLVSVHSQLVKYISIIKTRQNCYYILPHCLHCWLWIGTLDRYNLISKTLFTVINKTTWKSICILSFVEFDQVLQGIHYKKYRNFTCFLVRKFCEKAQFLHSFGRIAQVILFIYLNFPKLSEIIRWGVQFWRKSSALVKDQRQPFTDVFQNRFS